MAGVEDWRRRCWAVHGRGSFDGDCAGGDGEMPDAMADLGREIGEEVEGHVDEVVMVLRQSLQGGV